VQGTTDCPHDIPDALLPQTDPVCDHATALHTAVHRLAPQPPRGPRLVRHGLLPRQLLAAGALRRSEELALGPRAGQTAQGLPEPAARGPGRGGGLGKRLILAAAAVGGAPQEERAQGLDAQDMFDRMVRLLAALTRRRCRRVWGADAPPCGAGRGTRGEAGAAAGPLATGAGACARGATRGAASAAETPSRCARAVRERAGAAPRARRAARRAGRRTGLHCWAWPGTIPQKRPCPPGRAEVWRSTRMHHRRSAGVGRGPLVETVNRRAGRGFPSIRHAAIRAWNAAAQGGTRSCNSSRVPRVQSRPASGRDCSAVPRKPARGRASWHGIVMSEAHHTLKRDKLN
jgi:hypothetical protein